MSPTEVTAASGMTMRLFTSSFMIISTTQQQSFCSLELALTVMPVVRSPVTLSSPYTAFSTSGFRDSSRVKAKVSGFSVCWVSTVSPPQAVVFSLEGEFALVRPSLEI